MIDVIQMLAIADIQIPLLHFLVELPRGFDVDRRRVELHVKVGSENLALLKPLMRAMGPLAYLHLVSAFLALHWFAHGNKNGWQLSPAFPCS